MLHAIADHGFNERVDVDAVGLVVLIHIGRNLVWAAEQCVQRPENVARSGLKPWRSGVERCLQFSSD